MIYCRGSGGITLCGNTKSFISRYFPSHTNRKALSRGFFVCVSWFLTNSLPDCSSLRTAADCLVSGIVPLFLIHYVHKNAGRGSLVLTLRIAKTSLRRSIPHAKRAGALLHPHEQKRRPMALFLVFVRVRGIGHLHINIFCSMRLENIVLRDPVASVPKQKPLLRASPEALFDSSHPLPTATASNTSCCWPADWCG